ncbi:hypothetical protein HDC36_004481 [Xanthomonas sp. JAI131]|uniref:hypothetical protein n=1 Tax=Xanthomonas sp. JAI131 TaxID=2723067 RepID=UPI0015C884B6|nr:hypothetical protein [Xanthomonas sp. JAI131]NYF22991.1 hypothetical protein [Xanthomonas sp. JAI131]
MPGRADRLLLCLALAALVPALAHAADWPEVPEPEGAKGEWVSKHMIYNGLHMRSSRYTANQSPQQLVAFYGKQWPGQVVVNEVGNKTIVGHAEGEHYVTIEITGAGAGSEAQVGIVRLLKEKPRKAPGADFLKPSGTTVVNDIEYLDNPGRTLALESPLSPYQGEAFYRNRLPAEGWSQQSSATTCSMISNSCVSSYSKGKQQMTLTFNRREKGTSIVVNQLQQ